MKRKIMCLGLLIAAVCSLTLSSGVLAEDDGSPPGLSDKMKDPDFWKPFVPSKPIPESEITRIKFSKDWLLKNDVEPDEGTVTIAFPKSWTISQPKMATGEETVELVVPTRLLNDHNMSKRDGEMKVTFPYYYFNGLEVAEEDAPDMAEVEPTERAERPDYEEREWWEPSGDELITGASGRVRPYQHDNDDFQHFVSYHEIEFGDFEDGTEDGVEIISAMWESPGDTALMFAVYDDGDQVYGFDCRTDIEVGDYGNYEWYTNYDEQEAYWYVVCWIEYPDDTWYMDWHRDDTYTPHYKDVVGSAEVYETSPWHEDFLVRTQYSRVESLLVDGEWSSRSDIEDLLEYNKREADDWVTVTDYMSSTSGLRFKLTTYYNA